MEDAHNKILIAPLKSEIVGLFTLLVLFALRIFTFSLFNDHIYIYLVLNAKFFCADFKQREQILC